jgi:DNA-binding transcriptional ArsR family regulator
VEFRQLAAVEACLALWVARAPEQEPLADNARRAERRLSRSVLRRASDLDTRLSNWPLWLMSGLYWLGIGDVDEAVRVLAGGCVPFGPLGAPAVAPAAGSCEATWAPRPDASRNGHVRGARDQSAQIATDAVAVLHDFWHGGFGHLWERQRPILAAHFRGVEEQLSRDPGATLAFLSPRALHDRHGDCVSFLGEADEVAPAAGDCAFDCDDLQAIDVIPSFWLRRRVVFATAPGRVGLCVGPSRDGDLRMADDRLVDALAVLGDRHRLEIIRLCTAQPRSTQELALLLHLTQAPVSRHLHELKRHGLVVARRCGRFVLYQTVPEEVAFVSRRLRRLTTDVAVGEVRARPSL